MKHSLSHASDFLELYFATAGSAPIKLAVCLTANWQLNLLAWKRALTQHARPVVVGHLTAHFAAAHTSTHHQ
jgi:hypothetical protein